jgi:hypothetical protein
MKFIVVTDAITNKIMTIRADLIFKIEESQSSSGRNVRMITFQDGQTEFVTNSMLDLLRDVGNN